MQQWHTKNCFVVWKNWRFKTFKAFKIDVCITAYWSGAKETNEKHEEIETFVQMNLPVATHAIILILFEWLGYVVQKNDCKMANLWWFWTILKAERCIEIDTVLPSWVEDGIVSWRGYNCLSFFRYTSPFHLMFIIAVSFFSLSKLEYINDYIIVEQFVLT